MHERTISLDTETTGTSHAEGDRIVEIGAVELLGNIETGRTYHVYLNPYPKPVSQGALEVHGLTDEFLSDKPKFRQIVNGFLEFIGDAPLIIHNAGFDVGFINAELAKAGRKPLSNEIRDTLKIARNKYPGQRASLDALCSRLGVDNSGRDLHGALIDASLLAQVYVKMQELDRLSFGSALATLQAQPAVSAALPPLIPRKPRPARAPFEPSPSELAAHAAFIASDVKDSIWLSP